MVILPCIVVAILFVIAVVQNSVDQKSIIATPSIPRENGILSGFASMKIKAPVEQVFEILMKFKDYSKELTFSEHEWNVIADGVPTVGSIGSMKLSIDVVGSRRVPVKLTLLDYESKRVAEMTYGYPGWLLASERVQEVAPLEGYHGWSEYKTWHTVTGIASYYLLFAKEEHSEALKRDACSLRDYLESGKK